MGDQHAVLRSGEVGPEVDGGVAALLGNRDRISGRLELRRIEWLSHQCQLTKVQQIAGPSVHYVRGSGDQRTPGLGFQIGDIGRVLFPALGIRGVKKMAAVRQEPREAMTRLLCIDAGHRHWCSACCGNTEQTAKKLRSEYD